MASQTIGAQTRRKLNLLPSVVETTADHEKRLERIEQFLFTGDVEKNEPSLSERIRNIEKILQNMNRIVWIATTAIVGAISVYIWEMLIK